MYVIQNDKQNRRDNKSLARKQVARFRYKSCIRNSHRTYVIITHTFKTITYRQEICALRIK